ncbi:3-(cis-5,6-dihydroxycyclohexa-1,3-dien-1-yl)propanoate dehydrogenase [Nesterenkonia sphaerica]|uniref:3-(Cis-5,6-dihydroxycyclohexa-1, 3-dien-1-yl)propanoate dehydrogenase n=1 Tax=Nesterenkonia sphaerica TaxID=1804988 RepID=A0A5R8ZY76_9MICC|nr:3-(cis-5,6-dihydroxycyclohexa-1,3-dien-1-yl)propanoate dehydrogenase [Nesterenkonia sphaerica]TLP71210.1 3-(cis-5,6-dihydroxycyclohexa-1,3-dien-1-yl)propanoate dehydrogenase [Nesterenkonia sphaerica]
MTKWLVNKRVLVVGAGSGIGRAVVAAFLDEGAQVSALERDTQKGRTLSQDEPSVPVTIGDASVSDANRSAVERTVESFGGLDVLVQCVGIFDYYKGIRDLTHDEIDTGFNEMFNINVKSHMHSIKAATASLEESGGSIILTESTSAYYPGRGGALYVPSKFAVRGLVKTVGHELAPRVRVNAVAPGGTTGTDMRGLQSLGLGEESLGRAPGRAADLAARVPLNTALSAMDHAGSYVFLASDRAKGISGDVIHTDGGMALK